MDIEKILTMYEDDYNPSSMVPGPRNMADGGVIGKPGGIVEHGVEYYGKSYKPGNPAYEAALERSRQLSENAPEGMKYDRKLKKYVKSKQKTRTKEINKIQKNVLNFVNKKLKNKKYVSIPEIAKNVKDLNLKEGTLSPDKKSSAIIRRALENEKYRNKPILSLLGKQEYQDTRAAGFLKKAKTLVSDQEKILDLAMSGKYKTANEIKKATNLPAKKFEKELIKLYSNIYEERNRVNQGLKKFSVFLPRDEKQLKNILNIFADIDGFQGPETRSIFKLVRETYGKEGTNPNMKKYKEATSKLIDYYGTVKEIQKKYPTIKLDLDHPLDFKTIEGLGKKGEKFLHITPVSENLNRGLFKVIGTQYRSALESGDAKFIQNVEKLADDLGINIGKVKGKRIKDFGTSIIGESDFKKEIIENLKKQNVIADKVNPMQKSGELKKRLLEIGVKKPKDYNIEKTTANVLKKLEAHGCKGKAAGGRILFSNGSPDGKITTCATKGITRFIDDLRKGNYSKATLNILKGGGNLIKNIVNPMELLKLKNLIGPGAMGLMAAWEGGVITDDVIRQGTPLNESLANNWLTKAFLPYTKDYAKAKNLLETGKVPSNMKKYVEDVVTFNEMLMDMKGIQGRKDSRLVDDSFGMIDGTSMYTKEQEQKEDEALMKKAKTLTENVFTPGTAKALEMKSLQDEMEATRMAKPKSVNILGKDFQYSDGFSPMFGFDELKDVRTKAFTGIDDYMPDETPQDLRPITYKDYEKTELPAAERQYYENKYNIKPRSSLSEYYFPGSKVNVLEELTSKYNMREASKYPGFFSADSEKFSEGGITTLRSKYEYKK